MGRHRRTGAERAALQALRSYRAMRLRDGGGVECLVERAEVVEREVERGRRRQEVVGRAVREGGVDRDLAEQVYDVALQEGVEPAFALELVRCGVAVGGEPEVEPDEDTIQVGAPPWLAAAPSLSEAERERRLRMSLRRLRGLLETHESAEDALIAFVQEPDVEEGSY